MEVLFAKMPVRTWVKQNIFLYYGDFPPENNASIEIAEDHIQIEFKKKRDLPQLLEMMKENHDLKCPCLVIKKLVFYPSATS